MFIYASCKDSTGVREYLVADTELAIEEYCLGLRSKLGKVTQPDLLFKEKAIIAWYTNPDPIMVCHHFTWVGKGRRPSILSISRPFNYKDSKKPGPVIDDSF